MARQTKKPATPKTVEALKHEEARRKNIPTAEYQSVTSKAPSAFPPDSGGVRI